MNVLNRHGLRQPLAAVMVALVIVATGAPVAAVVRAQSSTTSVVVQQLIQQAAVIRPSDPSFAALQQQFIVRVGLSSPALAAAFQNSPHGQLQDYSGGMTYSPLAANQALDMKSVATGQMQSALLGVLQVPAGAHMGSISLPAQLGVAVMAGSFVVVLIDLTSGQIIAFILLPVSPILAVVFFPAFSVIQVVIGLILTTPTILFPFPIPIPFACPGLPIIQPFNVQVGSGLPLVTVTNGSQPLFQVSDGGLAQLRVTSFGPSLNFSLMGAGIFSFGILIGAGSSQVQIPFATAFRLLVQGGGKTACIQAIAFSFGFGAMLTGTAAHN